MADVRNLSRPPCSNMKHESYGPKPRLRAVFPGFSDAQGCLSEQCEARSGCNFRCCRLASVSMCTANVVQPTGSELEVDFQCVVHLICGEASKQKCREREQALWHVCQPSVMRGIGASTCSGTLVDWQATQAQTKPAEYPLAPSC